MLKPSGATCCFTSLGATLRRRRNDYSAPRRWNTTRDVNLRCETSTRWVVAERSRFLGVSVVPTSTAPVFFFRPHPNTWGGYQPPTCRGLFSGSISKGVEPQLPKRPWPTELTMGCPSHWILIGWGGYLERTRYMEILYLWWQVMASECQWRFVDWKQLKSQKQHVDITNKHLLCRWGSPSHRTNFAVLVMVNHDHDYEFLPACYVSL